MSGTYWALEGYLTALHGQLIKRLRRELYARFGSTCFDATLALSPLFDSLHLIPHEHEHDTLFAGSRDLEMEQGMHLLAEMRKSLCSLLKPSSAAAMNDPSASSMRFMYLENCAHVPSTVTSLASLHDSLKLAEKVFLAADPASTSRRLDAPLVRVTITAGASDGESDRTRDEPTAVPKSAPASVPTREFRLSSIALHLHEKWYSTSEYRYGPSSVRVSQTGAKGAAPSKLAREHGVAASSLTRIIPSTLPKQASFSQPSTMPVRSGPSLSDTSGSLFLRQSQPASLVKPVAKKARRKGF